MGFRKTTSAEAGLSLSNLVSKLDAGSRILETGCRIKFTAVRRLVENLALDQDFVKR
jgi:hypothetical protein